jgi:hypothetical protein
MNRYAQITVKEDFLSRPYSNETITGSGAIQRDSVEWKNTYGQARFRKAINVITSDYQKQPENFTTLSVREGLRRYETPFKWRPNLIAIAADNSVSDLLPNPSDCDKIPCTNTTNNRNASLLAWNVFTPSGFWWNSLCDLNFQGPTGAKCSKLPEWTNEDVDAWRMGGKQYQIKRFLMNPNPVTQGSLSQQKCHLQCSPVILLGTSFIVWLLLQSGLILHSGHYFQLFKMLVHLLGHMVF